jgi:hypothetical protein
MNWIMWAMLSWVTVGVLAVPASVRLCRCIARFDPSREQLAAAAAGAERRLAFAPLLIERRQGGDRRRGGADRVGRRRTDVADPQGETAR